MALTKKITIVDYGMGNIFNLSRALEELNCDVEVSSDVDKIKNADKLLLPGVGAFKDGINGLKAKNLDIAINEYILKERPIMGICLGMQLLLSSSEENGQHQGLDIIKGTVKKFKKPNQKSADYKIPQIGWNTLNPLNKNSNFEGYSDWKDTILNGFIESPYMYFLHSYYVMLNYPEIIVAQTSYGQNQFCSVFQKNNIIGCQFHPERSAEKGLKLLNNFLKI